MPRLRALAAGSLLLVAGCVTMTPEAKLRNEVFWEAAKECEGRYRTLHLDNIDPSGGITMHADAETRAELAAFKQCYAKAVQTRVDARRKAGEPVPPELLEEPSVSLD